MLRCDIDLRGPLPPGRSPRGLSFVLTAALLFVAVPARAQIYSWRDANGNLVLSNKKPLSSAPSVKSYAVPKADTVRATRYAAVDRGRQYDDLIFEHAQ